MEIYRDKVTGLERIFLVLGNPGIISGVYDESQPTKIRWDADVEFPTSGTFSTRPLGIVEANCSLLFSVGGVIYQRIDGLNPTYTDVALSFASLRKPRLSHPKTMVLNLGDGVNTDVGGIRGLTTITNPNGAGESVLFLWAPNSSSIGQIKRLDPDGSGGYMAVELFMTLRFFIRTSLSEFTHRILMRRLRPWWKRGVPMYILAPLEQPVSIRKRARFCGGRPI